MLKVLIVDDTKAVHAFFHALMKTLKDVTHADVFDGAEAIELLKTGEKFDLIFLDWEMPRLNGPQTFAEFKNLGVTTPVIMTTTKNSPEEIRQMLEAGVAEYMMKPFTLDIMIEKMESVYGVIIRAA